MPSLYVSEYASVVVVQGAVVPAPLEPAVTTQKITFTTATQSAALNAQTRFVRLHADANCHVAFGANPTATASSARLASGTTEFFGVGEGQGLKLSVYDGTS